MCGRARCSLAPHDLRAAAAAAAGLPPEAPWLGEQQYHPTYNAAPGAWLPVMRVDEQGQPILHTMKWGLVPSFTPPAAAPDHWRMFNARAEGLATKPVFSRLLAAGDNHNSSSGGGGPVQRQSPYKKEQEEEEDEVVAVASSDSQQERMPPSDDTAAARHGVNPEQQDMPAGKAAEDALGSPSGQGEQGASQGPSPPQAKPGGRGSRPKRCVHRCVVLLNGFYEWKVDAKGKQPYYIGRGEEHLLLAAGLWDTWTDGEGQVLPSCTIVTVDASQRFASLHNRMPALLPTQEQVAAWLGGATSASPADLVEKVCRPYNGPDLVWHPVTPAMSKLAYQAPDAYQDVRSRKGAITSFFKPKATVGGGASSSSKAGGSKAGSPGGQVAGAAATAAVAGGAAAGAEAPTINTDADSRGEVAASLHPHKRPPSPGEQAGGKRAKV